jgi:hypothetical protein
MNEKMMNMIMDFTDEHFEEALASAKLAAVLVPKDTPPDVVVVQAMKAAIDTALTRFILEAAKL